MKKLIKKNTNIIIIICLLILISLIVIKYYFYIQKKQEDDSGQDLNNTFRNKEFVRIKNKKIKFVNKAFDYIDFRKNSIYFLSIYQESDCVPCITTSKIFSSLFNKNNLLTLYLSDKKNDIYNNTEYKKKKKDINYYLKKIYYIKTPVILKFDSTFKVLDAFFPTVHKDEEFEMFVKS